MISISLNGGLGNQLFQLGFLEYVKKITGKQIFLSDLSSPKTSHSSEQYFETIFEEWKNYFTSNSIEFSVVHEDSTLPFHEWKTLSENICYVGFFQRYEYLQPIKDSLIQKLKFNNKILEKYPDIYKKTFIHVRGGDFLDTPTHNVNLIKYYYEAMKHFENNFVIFTNDVPYAQWLFTNIYIIQESEVDTLFLMSKCSGCICANSSFSWWGAYLDCKRKICLPSRWVNYEYHHETYRVPGWIVI